MAQISRPKQRWRDFPDQYGARCDKKVSPDFRDQGDDEAHLATKVRLVRLSNQRDLKSSGATTLTGANFQIKQETARHRKKGQRFLRPRRRPRVFRDQGGDGATQTAAQFIMQWRDLAISRLPGRGGDGANFQANAETERLFRPSGSR